MIDLHIDIETFSDIPIKSHGLYRYADSSAFEVLLFAYKLGSKKTRVIDLAQGEIIPNKIVSYIFDKRVRKKAWNAAFEIYCLGKMLKKKLPVEQWECTMAKAAYNGYPLSLDAAGKALNANIQKDKIGGARLKYFCTPCKPTKTNGGRTRNLPEHNLEWWDEFKTYNGIDVDAETTIDNLLPYELPETEKKLFYMDMHINQRGICIDRKLVSGCVKYRNEHSDYSTAVAKKITGLENPNALPQIKKWIFDTTGETIKSINKDNIDELLTNFKKYPKIYKLLSIRKQLSLSSISKYDAMLNTVVSIDGLNIIRGLFQYYGAMRTGRWAGRQVQLHNLAGQKEGIKTQAALRKCIKELLPYSEFKDICSTVSDPMTVLKELIRTAFIPRPGHNYISADYKAIEARVIAWLANEKWKIDVFATHGKVYEATAARMFGVDISEVTKDSDYRKKGKISELALGFGGAVAALVKMGAIKLGIVETEDELLPIVWKWRAANSNIVKLWGNAQNAFITAFQHPGAWIVFCRGLLRVRLHKGTLVMKLPSDRCLFYPHAKIVATGKGQEIAYMGQMGQTKVWGYNKLYGGKIIENAVQAISRDLLAEAMLKLFTVYNIPMHVHDEIVLEVPLQDAKAKQVIESIMNKTPDWAPGLLIKTDIAKIPFYRKS